MAERGGTSETFEVPAEPESLDMVQDRLAAFWDADAAITAGDRMRLELAVVEVVGNIVEHAYALDAGHPGRVLTVALHASDDVLEAVLSDNGKPASLDLAEVTMPGEEATSGRGLALSFASVDELTYERVDGRNHWRLVCRRTGD